MCDQPRLTSGVLSLRPLTEADFPEVLAILQDPTVARWWGDYDLDRVHEEYADDGETVAFLVEVDGHTAGLIQYSEETDADYRHAGIDIALTEQFQRRGIGPTVIRLLARYLIDERGHHRITIDPAAANENAIRAYGRAGFRRVGVMRQYERAPDGTWHDGLLMDLLASELR